MRMRLHRFGASVTAPKGLSRPAGDPVHTHGAHANLDAAFLCHSNR